MPKIKLVTLICFALISVGFISVPLRDGGTESLLNEMRRTAPFIRQIDELSRKRTLEVKKLARIIDRFNSKMPSSNKLQLANEIFRMVMKYPNLDIDLIAATITHESARTWDPEIVSSAGALGLMQVMPSTGRWLAEKENIPWTSSKEILFNPILNIRLGCRYLSALIKAYDLDGGLAAYNGGESRVELWLAHNKADGILWAETQQYVPFVLKLYEEYRNLTM